LIGEMDRRYRQGRAGYTWLDAALDVASDHGYTILSDNGAAMDQRLSSSTTRRWRSLVS
jgi:hypothetical protein